MYKTSTAVRTKQLLLTPEGVVKWLALVVFVLLIANVAGIILEGVLQLETRTTRLLVRYFNFNGESNIPAFFSSILLLIAAGILFLIYSQQRSLPVQKQSEHWLLLGFVFLFLAVDENVQLHEHIAEYVRPLLPNDLNGFLHWAWVVPYAFLTVAVAAYFSKFAFELPRYTRNLFFLSGGLFVTGALGLELFEGYFYKRYGLDHLYNRILYCLEELMEMSGVVVFIYALLHFLAVRNTKLTIVPEDRYAECES